MKLKWLFYIIKHFTNFLGQTFAAAEEVHSSHCVQTKYCMGEHFVIKDKISKFFYEKKQSRR